MKTAKYIILCNIALAILKITTGLFFGCFAICSDGLHNGIDVLVTLFATSKFKYKKYIFKILILAIALYIIVRGLFETSTETNWMSIAVTCFSMFIKECMFHAENSYGKRINSPEIIMDSWHQRTDGIISLGVLIGLILSKFGLNFAQPLACLFAGFCLVRVALKK